MVRVLMCHSFKEQRIFSDAYEPTAIACSVLRDLVFVGTNGSHIFVYSLLEDGFPPVYHFPSLSPSRELIFSDVGDYLLTKETIRKDKPGQCSARVYFNWSKWQESEGKMNQKIKVQQVGFSVTQRDRPDPEALTVVEILSRFSVRTLACCPSTGNIAVATETRVTVYRKECSFDFQRMYIVEPGFSIHKLAICEQFVAFASASEVRVLKVTVVGQSDASMERCVSKDGFNSETEQFLTKGALTNIVRQREVFDENFVVWTFNQCSDSSSEQTSFWDSLLASKEWNEGNLQDCHATPSLAELPLIDEEVPFIDYSEESCEVLGPVKVVHGHPLKVQGVLNSVQDVTMLYRYFEADVMKTSGDSPPELHTLQLIPFYSSGSDENDGSSTLPRLSGMMCFVSCPKKGFIYDVFTITDFLSHCTYTSDTKTAVIGENLLYAVTSEAVETYTVPLYAAVAKTVRSNKPSGFSDIIEPVVSSVTSETGVNLEDKSEGTSERILQDFRDINSETSTDVVAAEKMKSSGIVEPEDENQNLTRIFGFPVYDTDILQKPCPSPSSDLCMIGIHPFNDLYFILTAGDQVLLLSDTTSASPSKQHKKGKGKGRKEPSQTKDWTLHSLKAMNMEELYFRMESLIEKSENLNADLRLLIEQHLILRAQFQVGKISEIKRNSLVVLLKNSVRNLGDYYARYAVEDPEEVLLYYGMANLSIQDVVDHHVEETIEIDKIRDKEFGNGLVCYLNDVFFSKNQEKNCVSLPQPTADKVLYIYCNAAPSRLSVLILRPLIDGYTPEIAVKLLAKLKKSKSYSFTTEDHLALAIVYLNVFALEHAAVELLNLAKDKLAEMCVKHHYVLYEKGKILSPLGQLLRRRLPKVFVKTLVSLHLRGIASFGKTVELLQGEAEDVHSNSHSLEFLELVLNDQKGKKSFKEARELLIEIYLEKLSKQTIVLRRELLRSPHYHIPRGSGHFAKRFPWLDKLPPFNGRVLEPKDCPFAQANVTASPSRGIRRFPSFSRSRTPQQSVSDAGAKTSCTCCCCWEILLKLQSLLCSKYCDRELGNCVLKRLMGRSLSGEISITLLCLPLVDEHEKWFSKFERALSAFTKNKLMSMFLLIKAVESLLLLEPSVVLTYSKQFFGKCHTKWQCVLNVLTQRIRLDQDSKTSDVKYKEILEETLTILSKYTTPSVFLSLLPDDGNFAFFLPFLVECCQKNAAQQLCSQITAR